MACLWLSTKVEEFNVSISQFVENSKESPQQSMRSEDLILALELPIISALKVGNPSKTQIQPKPNPFLVSFNNSQSISTNGRVSDRYASTMCRSPGRGRTQASCGRISYKGIEDRCSIIISAVNYCIDKLLASSSS